MLRCFVDESGNHDGPVMVMAGVISDLEGWEKFSHDWQECLDMLPKMKSLHMAEFFRQSWGDESKDRIRRFHRIYDTHIKGSIVVSLPVKEYKEIFLRSGPFSNPYLFLFFDLIRTYRKMSGIINLSRTADFVFDEQNSKKEEIIRAWEFLRDNSPDGYEIFGNRPVFGDDEKILPLQAADMLSWFIHRQLVDDDAKRDRLEFPWTKKDSIPCIRSKWNMESLKETYKIMFL